MARLKTVFAFFVAIVFAAFPTTAAPIVYTGYDIGSVSLAGSPNATAAAAAFDIAAGALPVIDFETGLPAGVTTTAGITNASNCFTTALHCYATSGTMVATSNGWTFTFATPIDSFGAYFTGWQVLGQTIGYSGGGGAVTLPMGPADFSGGTRFFGFVDIGASISSITYTALGDFVGIDDVRYGSASVPEPTTLLLLGTGLAVVAYRRRRK